MRSLKYIVFGTGLIGLSFGACRTLKSSPALVPIAEYEKMIAGRLDSDFVGVDMCLESCHFHDELRRHFEASTMGAPMDADSGMPIVDCESCHGPGSLAIEELDEDKVREDAASGVQAECRNDTFTQIRALPAPAQSLICLKCHTAESSFNLHDWNSSGHALGDVACTDCHSIHAGPDLIIHYQKRSTLCLGCHEKIFALMSLPSRHPIAELKMTCTDCHNPHGGADGLLLHGSVRETCGRCHAEQLGPFAFDHADTLEDCAGCHEVHGSVNDNLLKMTEPMLCMQCHSGHFVDNISGPNSVEAKAAFFSRCTDCHSAIHGTDIPAPSGRGTFTR